MHIVDDEHRRDRPQAPCAQRVSSGAGLLRRWRSSTMYTDIACVAPPCICPAALETRPLLLLGQAPRQFQSSGTHVEIAIEEVLASMEASRSSAG